MLAKDGLWIPLYFHHLHDGSYEAGSGDLAPHPVYLKTDLVYLKTKEVYLKTDPVYLKAKKVYLKTDPVYLKTKRHLLRAPT